MEFPGVLNFGLRICEGCKIILWNMQGWSFVFSGIFRGKVKKNRKTPGEFEESISSSFPVFFPGIAHYPQHQQKHSPPICHQLS